MRKLLADGGKAALADAKDPLIELMQEFEPLSREMRDRSDREIEGVTRLAGARIAETFFAVNGRDVYPDATFSLRVTYAPVAGYEENGVALPWSTTLGGYFERVGEVRRQDAVRPAAGLVGAKEKLDPKVPAVFVTTHDIIGGNSGSPVVDRRRRVRRHRLRRQPAEPAQPLRLHRRPGPRAVGRLARDPRDPAQGLPGRPPGRRAGERQALSGGRRAGRRRALRAPAPSSARRPRIDRVRLGGATPRSLVAAGSGARLGDRARRCRRGRGSDLSFRNLLAGRLPLGRRRRSR